MTEKVKLTQEQADAIDTLTRATKGMLVVDLLRAIQEGYDVEPTYKVGEWVARIDGKNIYPKSEIMVVEVFAGIGHLGERDMVRHGTDGEWGIPVAQLRHATPKEIKAEKERRVWAKIGREVGEFKLGDIGMTSGGFHYSNLGTIKGYYSTGVLKGIYPAESFISFEEADSNA